jgi:hypothetical protein
MAGDVIARSHGLPEQAEGAWRLTEILVHGLWFVMTFVLVGSSLALRRLPRTGVLRLILIWLLIFTIVWALVLLLRG